MKVWGAGRRRRGPNLRKVNGRIDYQTTPVDAAARLMVARHGEKAAEVARNREDAANTEDGAAFWLRVGEAIHNVK